MIRRKEEIELNTSVVTDNVYTTGFSIEELPQKIDSRYNNILEQIINTKSNEKISEIIMSSEYQQMCTDYLDFITEDCILYKSETDVIIWRQVDVAEEEYVRPYNGYMLFCYDTETTEGNLLGKIYMARDEMVYCASSKWEIIENDKRIGYIPGGETNVYMALPAGYYSLRTGNVENGLWDGNIVSGNYDIDLQAYTQYEMDFSNGYMKLISEEGFCAKSTMNYAGGSSYTDWHMAYEEQKAQGIIGYGHVVYVY